MPDRIIRAGVLTSDKVCSLSWPAEVFYRRLMSIVDDFGRYDGRLAILRANLYPLQLEKVSDSDVGKWRLETAKAGLVRAYSVDGKEFVELLNFGQRLRASVSKWPAPPSSADKCPQTAASGGHKSANAAESDAESDAEAKSRKRAPPYDPTTALLPDFIPTAVWLRWCASRKEQGHPLKPTTVEQQLQDLGTWKDAGHDPVSILENSIRGGYQGLFPPKSGGINGTKPSGMVAAGPKDYGKGVSADGKF